MSMQKAPDEILSQEGIKSANSLRSFKGHIVSPLGENELLDIADGLLVVDSNGRIVFVGEANEGERQFAEVKDRFDFGRKLIMPGLIDMHVHLPQMTQIGRNGEHLLNWLDKYIFPSEARFSDVAYATRIANWFFDELLTNGTTLAVVFSSIHKEATDAAFAVAAERGNRAIIGKVMMNTRCPEYLSENLSDSLSSSEELCLKWHGYDSGRLQYAFTPRFAVSCTDEMLTETGKLWQHHAGSYMHTHVAESDSEVALVSELFPQSRSYLSVYSDRGLTGPRSVLAHAIHLDSQDLKEIGQSRSALAHCPSSNFFLKSGVFPYSAAKEHNILFGLGSDVAAGPQMSMMGVMKDAHYIQSTHWISPTELLYRATLAGAEALQLADRLGSLEVGKEADFIVIDPSLRRGLVSDILEHETAEIISSLVFLGDDRVVERTFIRGKQVYISDKAK